MASQPHHYHAIPDNKDILITDDIEHGPPALAAWITTPHRRQICKILSTLAVLAIVSHVVWEFAAPYRRGTGYQRQPLRFTKEGTFQISVFEDLHFGENAWDVWGPEQDIKTLRVMNNVLDMEKPNLVVLNGDLITGENTFRLNSSSYLDMLVQPIVSRNLPFASTYGNHDSAYNLSRQEIFAREGRCMQSLTGRMVDDEGGGGVGVTNYYLEVWPYESQSENKRKRKEGKTTPSLILWFFDSRGGHIYQQTTTTTSASPSRPPTLVPQPNWVSPTVVSWFLSTHASLTQKYNKEVIPSVAFVHIPTNASAAFQTEVGVDSNLQPGINDDYVLAMQGEGWCPDSTNPSSNAETEQEEKEGEGEVEREKKERTCRYGGQDLPFMRAIANTKGVKVVVTGHDHGNSWCFKWNSTLPGVEIDPKNGLVWCFGQRTGYGGYGGWERGGRQILVKMGRDVDDEDGGEEEGEDGEDGAEIETWIRLESGRVVGAVSLNETFGRDRYPATEDRGSP